MTPPSHLVVIAIAANELSSPHTSAILRSAQDVLGPAVTVRLEAIEQGYANGNEALSKPTSDYARLSWDERAPGVAHLRCFIPDRNRWVQRDVRFEEQDPERERWRTLGFVIGSIFVEGHEPPSQDALSAPSIPKKNTPPERKRFQLAVAGAVAAPEAATSLGIWAGAQRHLSPFVSIGLASEVRMGTIAAAQTGTRFYSLGATANLRLLPQLGPAWLGVGTFFGGEFFTFTHRSEDDRSAVTESAFVPRLDLLLRGNLELEGASVLFLELGTNYRFGETDVYVHNLPRAHVPAFIGIGRIGVGTRF